MVGNKNHWYDGWFFDKVIAPNQTKVFDTIKNLVNPGSTILDVGCGTGKLAFTLNSHCSFITSIDPSKRNIDQAQKNLNKSNLKDLEFLHTDLESYCSQNKRMFDYSTLTYVIHEVDENKRVNILKQMSSISQKIIICDFLTPAPKNMLVTFNDVIEYLAGKEHFTNYKSYIRNGGIYSLAEAASLKITYAQKNLSSWSLIAILSKD